MTDAASANLPPGTITRADSADPSAARRRTATERAEAETAGSVLSAQLRERGVEAAMTTVATHCGTTQGKGFPVRRLAEVARTGVGLSPVSDAFIATGEIPGGQSLAAPDGDLRCVPDLSAGRVVAGEPAWAWFPADRYEQDGTEYRNDQRGFARRMIAELAAAGMTARAGFELEWLVGDPTGDGAYRPGIGEQPYSAQRLLVDGYGADVMAALDRAGILVHQLHGEYSPGQFEVSLPVADPLTAADDHVLARLVIADVTRRRGLRATFSPAIEPGYVGNGGHMHLSLSDQGGPLFGGGPGPGGLTATGGSVVAALLEHLPALLAIFTPLSASYLRLRPSSWSGAHRIWGIENREAAVRLIVGHDSRQQANIELKNADPTANPYLAVGSVLAVVLDGCRVARALPDPVSGDPAGRGHERLPADLATATAAFRADPVLAAAMGESLHRTVAENREAEVRRTRDLTADEIAESTRWWS